MNPEDPKAHYNLALLYARLKEPERAREEMQIVERLKGEGAGRRRERHGRASASLGSCEPLRLCALR